MAYGTTSDDVPVFELPIIKYQARRTPIGPKPIDPEMYKALVYSIKALEETKKDWAKMTVDSRTDAYQAAVEGTAEILSAIMNDDGMQAQAKARFQAAVVPELQKLVSDASMMAPDGAAMTAYNADKSMAQASFQALASGSRAAEWQNALASAGADPDAKLEAASDLLMNTVGTDLYRKASEKLAAVPDASAAARTAIGLQNSARNLMASEIMQGALTGPDGKPMSTAERRALAGVVDAKLTSMFAKNAPPGTDELIKYQAAKAQEYERKFDAMAAEYGVSKSTPGEFKSIVNEMLAPMKGGMEAYAYTVSNLPGNPGLQKALNTMYAQLDAMGGTPDPFTVAERKLRGNVPGWDSWQQAMRFRSNYNATMYAARHPNELRQFMAWTQENPALLEDIPALRKMIVHEGRKQGWGYFGTPLGRALQIRLPFGKFIKDAQPADLDTAMDRLADMEMDRGLSVKGGELDLGDWPEAETKPKAETAETDAAVKPSEIAPVKPATAPTPTPTPSAQTRTSRVDAEGNIIPSTEPSPRVSRVDAEGNIIPATTEASAKPSKPSVSEPVTTPAPSAKPRAASPLTIPGMTPAGEYVSKTNMGPDGKVYGITFDGSPVQLDDSGQWNPVSFEEEEAAAPVSAKPAPEPTATTPTPAPKPAMTPTQAPSEPNMSPVQSPENEGEAEEAEEAKVSTPRSLTEMAGLAKAPTLPRTAPIQGLFGSAPPRYSVSDLMNPYLRRG